MAEQDDFAGGVAVITGAGAGIGAGLAREAARIGMTVIVADIAADRAAEVVADITARGGRGEPATVDVRDDAAMDALAAAVRRRHGKVRLVINNAGVEMLGFSWELSAEQWRRSTDINVMGVVNGVRAFAPGMIEDTRAGGRAAIANVSSVGGLSCSPMMAPYTVSKHAVLSFTECLLLEMELTGHPIDISLIVPAMVRSRIFDDAPVAAGAGWAEAYRAQLHARMGDAMDVDEAARVIFEGLAERRYWVSTQPEATQAVAGRRAELYARLTRPTTDPAILQRLQDLRESGKAGRADG